MGISLSSAYAVVGYGFDRDFDVVEFKMPFVFSDEVDAQEYAHKLKKTADRLASFYRNAVYRDHHGGRELDDVAYNLFKDRGEYWKIRSNRVWVEELEVR